MGPVLFGQFSALPHSEKEYGFEISRAKEREIRLEQEFVKAKARAYGKSGPPGPRRKRETFDVEELFSLLNAGDSPIDEIWKAGNKIGSRSN